MKGAVFRGPGDIRVESVPGDTRFLVESAAGTYVVGSTVDPIFGPASSSSTSSWRR